MGHFNDAIHFALANGGSPDVANVRRLNVKYGYGFSVEQSISPNMGFFVRAGLNDGKSETYSFTEIENSFTTGFISKANFWGRDADKISFAFAQNELTSIHQKYLSQGGTGAFIGDGNLRYNPERIIEANYNLNLYKTSWLSLGFQRIYNPAYN
ncbi:MAG: carbohydrate porin, partial [Bdellovibrionaceae bacterium]|nr:carbohydrate porin [Pseudobdellovibrionaceae bacterium]